MSILAPPLLSRGRASRSPLRYTQSITRVPVKECVACTLCLLFSCLAVTVLFVVCAHHAPRQKKHGRTCGVRRAFHPTTATLRDSADAGTPRVHPRLRRHRLPPCRASRRCVRQCELLCAGKQCIPTNLFVFCSMASHAGSITRTVRRAARSHTTPARPTASCTRTVLRDWQLCSTHTARRSVRDTSLHTTAPSTCGRPMLHSLCTPSASAPMCSARSARATASQCTPVLSANG